MDAPLKAYLEIAERYYIEDRLDAAMRVVTDAFEQTGWPEGLWTEFYNALQCEKDARDASDLHQLDGKLTIELPRTAGAETLAVLGSVGLDARAKVGELLRVDFAASVMITVFLPDAPVEFISGSHGYVNHKVGLEKICVPNDCLRSREVVDETLVHEFTHVGVCELAGDAVPRWLDEGLATYLCGELSTRHARLIVKTAARKADLPSLGELEAALTSADMRKDDPATVESAYFLASSLIESWVDRFGLDSMRRALVEIGSSRSVGQAVRSATGAPVSQLFDNWRRRLLDG